MKTSYSALETFENCPKKYEFQVIEKIKAPKSKEQIFGSSLHSSLKYLFSQSPLFPSLSDLLEYFNVYWQETGSKIDWPDQNEKNIFANEGRRILEEFYKKNIPSKSVVVALETRFQTEIDEPGKEEKKHILTGIIDRVDKKEDGSFEIIDYKTNRRLPSFDSRSPSFQLSIYALGFLVKWPSLANADLSNLDLSLYFLRHNEKLAAKTKKADLEAIKERILKNIREIEKGYFPPVPSPLCKTCAYRRYCPMWSHLYQEESPEEADIKKLIDEYFSIKAKNDQNGVELTKIKKQINSYLSSSGLERVFSETGFFAKSEISRNDYNWPDVEKILANFKRLDLWDQFSSPDKKKFETWLKKAPADMAVKLEKTKIEKKSKMLRAVKKSLAKVKQDLK